MGTACRPQLTFEFRPKLKTVARFDQAHANTDGGVVLLKAVDEHLQLTTRLAAGLLRTLLRRLRRAFPTATLRVRVDGGFAGNDWLELPESERIEYVVEPASNAGLTGASGACWGKPMACLSTVAGPSMSSGRRAMRPGVGRIAGG
jgi:hypothetical protein